jgi:hypothetical protein
MSGLRVRIPLDVWMSFGLSQCCSLIESPTRRTDRRDCTVCLRINFKFPEAEFSNSEFPTSRPTSRATMRRIPIVKIIQPDRHRTHRPVIHRSMIPEHSDVTGAIHKDRRSNSGKSVRTVKLGFFSNLLHYTIEKTEII